MRNTSELGIDSPFLCTVDSFMEYVVFLLGFCNYCIVIFKLLVYTLS